jgi:hypothetical protein
MEHFLTGFFCRKKDFWHIQSCRGENSNLAEFAQMRQKRMGIGAIKTSFGGIRPNDQKGTFLVDMSRVRINGRLWRTLQTAVWCIRIRAAYPAIYVTGI